MPGSRGEGTLIPTDPTAPYLINAWCSFTKMAVCGPIYMHSQKIKSKGVTYFLNCTCFQVKGAGALPSSILYRSASSCALNIVLKQGYR